MRIPALFAALILTCPFSPAADPSADISVKFTPAEGEPVSATATGALLGGPVALPLDVPNAIRIVEVAVVFDEEGREPRNLQIDILDPGTILPGASPKPMTLMHATVRFAAGSDIVFFKSTSGTWSVRVDALSKD
jgi:hypothetical protein